jgi:hypothetical protein
MITINREDFSDFVKCVGMAAGLDQIILATQLNENISN